jgi:CotH kinase protein/Lamin Tail Domain/Bacterial Ig domain/Calx-beta domain/Immunoglobulin domain
MHPRFRILYLDSSMKYLLQPLLCLSFFAAGRAWGDRVVINEIMYHPNSERVSEEYIELLNAGTNTVPLRGWHFSRGVSFTFTNDYVLNPNELVVVAADRAAFAAKYPGVTNVVGGWQGQLSNGGEQIQIEDADGNNVDTVDYADSGDWGTRQRGPLDQGSRGWEWMSLSDGLGSSMELINPRLPGNHGQNWAPSQVPQGSPGAPNTVLSFDLAPMILEATHFPAVPSSSDSVAVTCRIIDELPAGVVVTLWHRILNNPFVSAPMLDDGAHQDGLAGDGVYGAILPPQPNGTVVEFYLQASDGDHARTWPAPALDEFGAPTQAANLVYQVDDSVYTGLQPVYRLVMTEAERQELQFINRNSNAQMNGTFISTDGTGTKIRYNVGIRIRGASSRSAPVPNYRVEIPKDRPWNGASSLNFNAQYTHSQVAGAFISRKAGLPAADNHPMQVRVNGANLTTSSAANGFGSYALVEVVNGDWAQNHFPLDPNGNVYVNRRPNTDLTYQGTNYVIYSNLGYSKNSNVSENDWSDLVQLVDVLNNTSDALYVQAVRSVANVDEWITYFAINTMLGNGETALGTGVGDDYDMYRGVEDRRFLLVAHDWDTIFAQGQTPVGVTANLFRAANLPVVARFLRHPQFAPLYYKELKRLCDTLFTAEQIDPLLDQALGSYVPAQTIDVMKQYAADRRAYVLSQIPGNLTVNASGLSTVNGYLRTTSSTVSLNGMAPVIETRSVRVNGVEAGWTAWTGAWNLSGVALRPGINRILVQALDEQGRELRRSTIDVWYDDGSVADVSGTVASSVTWTAANGPYRLTGSVTVPTGVVLTIEPGTTLYFAAGARLYVNGRIEAEGTEVSHIRLTREPGGASSWNGIMIEDSTETNRLAYVDIDYANGGNAISLNESMLLIDHATWSGTANTIIQLNNSSIQVRNSVFPTIAAHEIIHGGPMPANGFVIIDGNTFGTTTGLNDIIDFTGARRPGPILQVLNNVFTGASDDVLDLDGTDAHVEGNVFMNVSNGNPSAPDTSSAISYGENAGYGPHVVAVRNLFFNCDRAVLVKEGGFLTFVNNTVLGSRVAAINFSEPQRNTIPGAGAELDGNIIWNTPLNFENQFPTNGTVALTVNRSILSGSDFPSGGEGNLNLNPRLANTNATTITVASIRDDFSLSLGSPARGTGPNGLDMGGLVPAGASISGEPLSPTPLTSAALTVGGPGIIAYRSSMNGGAFGPETDVSEPIELSGLADGIYQVTVIGKNSAGVWQEVSKATRSKTWIVTAGVTRLILNEVLARNDSAVVHEDTFPDLVELYNAGNTPADLTGMGLTDDSALPYKFKFPNGVSVGPGEYLVLYGDNETTTSGIHLGFGFDQKGDQVLLYDSAALGGALVDSVQFGLQLPDLSVGRDLGGQWVLNRPTFGSPNVVQPTGDPSRLKINEWGADGRSVFVKDFVELYNADTLPVPLGGLFLTDNILSYRDRHQIPALSFMAGLGQTAFLADGDAGKGADHLNFRLSPEQGELALYRPNLGLIDCVVYGPQTTDVSEGRRPSGSSYLDFFGPLTHTQPTPGAPNPGLAGSTTVTNIVVNLLPLDASWRYENSGADQGTAWLQPDFNDASWPLGQALLGVENSSLPPPGLITPFSPYDPFQVLYYFRTTFVATSDLTGFSLALTTVLDDGAVIYLNGAELTRIRMPGGPISPFTLPTEVVNNATTEFYTAPGTSLVQGTNVLDIEVHNAANPDSSDIIWGMALDATRSVTNSSDVRVVLNEVMANNLSVSNFSPANITDWVELFNPHDVSVNLAGLSLTDDSTEPRRFVFPAGTVIPAGEYLVVLCDGNLPASTVAGTALNTGFGLALGGDRVFLFDSPSRGGALLDSVVFGLQAADFSIGRLPNGDGPWALNLPTPGSMNLATSLGVISNLKINEWMANPSGGDDDYFEIYNPNPQPVSLGGLYLTDNLNNFDQYRIPDLSFVAAGLNGFALFKADSNPENGADHVNFKLSSDGEAIGLFNAAGTAIDTIVFGPQENGVSEGRFPDGSTTITRFKGTATPGQSNIRPLEGIVISEVLTHSDAPQEDAIELQNISLGAVDVSGWYLSDRKGTPKKFRIPDGTVLPPGGFAVFYEYQFNSDPAALSSFALSSVHGEELFLSTADVSGELTGYRGSVKFGASENGVTFGRHPTSTGFDFTAMSRRTLGSDDATTLEMFRTGTGLSNAPPKVSPIVISEIQYHPPDVGGTNDNVLDEFIELHNITGTNVPLYDLEFPTNRWRLQDAVDFDFPGGTVIPAGGYLLVVSFDPLTNGPALVAFRSTYGIGPEVAMVGPYDGKLDNSSEPVELMKPDAPQGIGTPDAGYVPYFFVDRVKYYDAGPWPLAADGFGLSLQRVDDSQFGNDPVNWVAAPPSPGAANRPPTVPPPSIQVQPVSLMVAASSTASFTVMAAGGVPLEFQWRFNGADIPGATNDVLNLNNVRFLDSGEYAVRIHNAFGSALSEAATLQVASPPFITKEPEDHLVAAGSTAFFTVSASGSLPLGYQWRKNQIDIPGANQSVLTVPNAQTADEGSYSVALVNAFGSATSREAVLTINQPPLVLASPQDQAVFVGTTVVLSVSATGAPPLRYQWRFNGAVLPGRTNANLTLNNVQLTDAGGYSVMVLNSVGSATSEEATLSVRIPPTLTVTASQAVLAEAGAGSTTFVITRTGSTNEALQVAFTVGGTAEAGADYTALTSPVSMPAGITSVPVLLQIINDTTPEGNETVILTLQSQPAYVIDSPDRATVTIMDDDNLAPSITLTNPIPDAVFTAPANVTMGASAFDTDGSVALVEFFADGSNKLGQATSMPFTFTWTNAPLGPHELSAVATDNLGATGVSESVPITINAAPTVNLTGPANGSLFLVSAEITLTASANDTDGTIRQVEFLEGNNVLGMATNAPFRFVWSNVALGNYTLLARATDDRGATTLSRPVSVSVVLEIPGFTDIFADRGTIAGFTNFLMGTNTTYTKEGGEPNHDGKDGNRTAWIAWLAPAGGPCTMDTLGSSFDTIMAVYTGNTVNALTPVVSNDDADAATLQSRVTFTASAGTLYSVAVAGYGIGEGGVIRFHQSMPNPGPVITSQPQNQTVDEGGTATFVVVVSGPAGLTYQWRFNGENMANQTSASLTLSNVEADQEGLYDVIVDSPAGSVTSMAALLTVRVAPQITTQPQAQVVDPGTSASLSVTASGTAPFTYQWRFNGAGLAGATGSTYSLPAVAYTNGGFYSVVVLNAVGSAISQPVELIVRPRILSPQMLPNGDFQFIYQGTPNRNYILEVTTNFQAWSNLGPVSSSTGQAPYTDSGAGNRGSRKFRLRVAP